MKAPTRPLFVQARVAAWASLFPDGLLRVGAPQDGVDAGRGGERPRSMAPGGDPRPQPVRDKCVARRGRKLRAGAFGRPESGAGDRRGQLLKQGRQRPVRKPAMTLTSEFPVRVERRQAGLCAIFILLVVFGATDATSSYEDAHSENRKTSLPIDGWNSFSMNYPSVMWKVGWTPPLSARTSRGNCGDRLANRALVGFREDIVHSMQHNKSAVFITHCDADPHIQLARPSDSPFDNFESFGKKHGQSPRNRIYVLSTVPISQEKRRLGCTPFTVFE